MSREFDVSVQNLIKTLYSFMSKEGVESHYEAMYILEGAKDKLHEEYILAQSVKAGAEGIKRIRDNEKVN